ncbi:hypothetical protein CFHF_04365 [Caulobacter flavus]|uniref:Uncharacterized protein n=1 Tax=Caulobacter flavus TaxID=1679497 RepID=A0A2N5CZL8_9CAUL|nr:hypothetical protein [Caulobacter flavus]AYV45078.1 hypothetical protein C1707_01805 [Caulobacter flavus]PLR19241.1 hypothetical protein CFHF_04365 [Caulobacter flavus]
MADFIQVLGGGITGALLTQGLIFLKEKASERGDAKITAAFFAAELEAFAFACADRHQQSAQWEHSNGEHGQPWRTVPDLAPMEKTNWRHIGIDDTQRIIQLRSAISGRNAELEAIFEFIDGEEAVKMGSDSCAEYGHRAMTITSHLYRRFKLKLPATNGDWNVREYLEREWKAVKAARLKEEARQREFEASVVTAANETPR